MNKKIAGLFLSCACLTLLGCFSPSSFPPSEPVTKNLAAIITQSTVSEKKRTPVEAVLNQLQWSYTTEEELSPTSQDVMWQTSFGPNSVVVLKVPHTSDPWYNFVFLSQQGEEWNISSIADSPCAPENMATQKAGLALPMERFLLSKMTFGSDIPRIWAFAGDTKTMVISKSPREPFVQPADAQLVTLNGHDAWQIISGSQSPLLFYFDQDQLVWLSGDLSAQELLEVARSLPSVSNPFFPSSEPSSS